MATNELPDSGAKAAYRTTPARAVGATTLSIKFVWSCLLSIVLGVADTLGTSGRPNPHVPGILLILGGLCGLLYQANCLRRLIIIKRKQELRESQRIYRRNLRRSRVSEKREKRRVERDRVASAQARRAEQRMQDRLVQRDIDLAQIELRNSHQVEVEQEASRILSLTDSEAIAETASVFHQRGFVVSCPDLESPFDMLVSKPGSDEFAVVRCTPVDRLANAIDLELIELWRQSTGAASGFLVSPKGFEEGVVLVVRLQGNSKPVMLVEAYLLAQWSRISTHLPIPNWSRQCTW